MSIKFFDMFSGIGGFRSGLEAIDGFECVGYCEIDKYAKKAYEAIYDTEGELYFEDARTIDPKDLPDIDLIVGGFPCQSFSICGKRGGFEDARGTLFFEIARIAEVKRPKYLLLENVPGFSASRSRRLQIVPIIQSFAQLEKNYGKEGADVIIDNTQLTIFGGFAPNSTSAEVLSKALGSRTVMSGSVSRNKNDPSQSLQMIERPLMTPDELKSLPKGTFVVMKTGFYPMKVKLKLFFKWGIEFEEKYEVKENGNREVHYANRSELFNNIIQAYSPVTDSDFDEASDDKKKKNENLKTSPNAEQTDSDDTINSEQQDESTEEPENSNVEQNADKQRKVVIRTERPPQEVLDNE